MPAPEDCPLAASGGGKRGQESPEAPRLFAYDASALEATSNSFNSSSHNIFAGLHGSRRIHLEEFLGVS